MMTERSEDEARSKCQEVGVQCTQELMRAEGPKERPTARYALGRARVLYTTLFG